MVSTLWWEPIEAWTASLRSGGSPKSTLTTRTYHLRRLAGWAGDRCPWSITGDELVAWTGAQDWSQETRRSYRSSYRSFYGWAVDTGRTDHNPALALPRVRAAQPNPRPAPEDVYRRALMDAGPRERLMLRLSAELGLRRAEVAQVHSDDLAADLTGWSLTVHGKGRKIRIVPLPDGIAAELRRLPYGYAFPGNDGGHLSPRWVGKLVTKLLPGDWTMHSLRHRFATLAYSVDRDLFAVQELLGHASPATTRTYVRLPDDATRRLVTTLARNAA